MSANRPRRTVLAVPGSNPKMLDKARGLAVDSLFMDLEDAVAPIAKDQARENIVAALNAGGYENKSVSVRVNGSTTPWFREDVEKILAGAGSKLDCLILPKAETAAEVAALDQRIAQAEQQQGLEPGRIGIEIQIESALGLVNIEQIAQASPRIDTLVFGPADFMASINMRSLVVGEQPPGYTEGDAFHYPLMRILVAARAFGIQAIDGPYLAIKDLAGLRKASLRSAALGFDGKWVLHPDQVQTVNEIFSPSQSDYDHAEAILQAYEHATSADGGARGAAMLGAEMIDEASAKMAQVIAAKGRAAGLKRTQS